jgi:DNA-binding beta-propeller fold protein YncE
MMAAVPKSAILPRVVGLAGGLVAIGIGVALTGSADARPGQLTQLSGTGACVSQLDTVGLCAAGRGMNAPDAVAVSPDGRSIYVASFGVSDLVAGNPGAVAVFRRTAKDGRIAQLRGQSGCVGAAVTRCMPARAVEGASGLAVSPDGRNVYVSALGSGAVAAFTRTATGGLAQLPAAAGCVGGEAADGCAPARGLEQPTDLALSADGRNVYVSSFGSGSVAAFSRSSTGQLTQLAGGDACVAVSDEDGTAHGCAAGRGLTLPISTAISPDGRNVYVLSDESLAVFRRAPSGALTQLGGAAGCLSGDGSGGDCASYPLLYAAIDIAVSPDGTTVYVSTYSPGAIHIFRRSRQTGALTPLAPVTGGTGLEGVSDVEVSPDGANLYAASPFSDAVLAFARAADGRLRQLPADAACVGDTEAGTGCAPGEVLTRAATVAVSPDNHHVYVTSAQAIGVTCACGEELGSLSVFSREVIPRLALTRPTAPQSPVRVDGSFSVKAAVATNAAEVAVTCTVRAGGRALRATGRYAAGVATCAGTVPPRTAGNRLAVTLRVVAGPLSRQISFSLPIRR